MPAKTAARRYNCRGHAGIEQPQRRCDAEWRAAYYAAAPYSCCTGLLCLLSMPALPDQNWLCFVICERAAKSDRSLFHR